MTVLLLIVAAALTSIALASGRTLSTRVGGFSVEAGRRRWRSANRGLVAALRRDHEAALVTRLARRSMTRTDYHRAMAALAAADSDRCPIEVPRLPAD